MLVLYCFGVATEFSANKDLCEDTETYIPCSVADKTSNNSARDPQLQHGAQQQTRHVHIHVCRIGRATATVGGAAQWQNVGLWPANFPCPALDLQLMGDH